MIDPFRWSSRASAWAFLRPTVVERLLTYGFANLLFFDRQRGVRLKPELQRTRAEPGLPQTVISSAEARIGSKLPRPRHSANPLFFPMRSPMGVVEHGVLQKTNPPHFMLEHDGKTSSPSFLRLMAAIGFRLQPRAESGAPASRSFLSKWISPLQPGRQFLHRDRSADPRTPGATRPPRQVRPEPVFAASRGAAHRTRAPGEPPSFESLPFRPACEARERSLFSPRAGALGRSMCISARSPPRQTLTQSLS